MLANNRWVRATGTLRDRPISIQYREDWRAVKDAGQLPLCVQIAWTAEHIDEQTGFPDLKEQSRILAFNEHLQTCLVADGNAVVTMMLTNNGTNQWVIYCRDLELLQQGLDAIPTTDGLYPIEIVADEDPEWSTFVQVFEVIKKDD